MAGLQGAGKTTTTGKLAKHLLREAQEEGADGLGRRLPAGGDRAAEDGDPPGRRRLLPVDRQPTRRSRSRAPRSSRRGSHYLDVLLVDTAGRLAIDES